MQAVTRATRVGALIWVVVAAGCGTAGAPSRPSAIEEALARSPLTYLYFRDRAWWGRDVSVEIGLTRINGDWAAARMSVSPARRPFRQQWALLRRQGRWRVVTSASRGFDLPCDAAPRGVVARLVGGCAAEPWVDSPALVTGRAPRAPPPRRSARHSRRPANCALFHGHDACVRYRISVSRVDDRYAEAAASVPAKPPADCPAGNGVSLYVRIGAAWHHRADASDGFACRLAPRGVVRSLDGACRTG